MINALRYEPRGQRQRFEPREQQHREGEEKHLHLHLHLNLTFWARKARSTPSNAMRITRIFFDLLAATVMFLLVFLYTLLTHDGPPDPLLSLGNLASLVVFAGLALAWGCGCLPLLVSTWRTNPRGRSGLFGPLVLRLGLVILFFPVVLLAEPLILLLTLVHPLVTALLLLRVRREVRALQEIAPAPTRFSFFLVSGMGIALLGVLLWNLSAVLSSLPYVWSFALPLPAMGAAVLVAMYTLFTSRQSTPPRPKDASPSDVDSEHMPRGYRDRSL